MNVYKVTGRKRFENILDKPIYLSLSKDKISETVTFDLKQYHIAVEGDFVITLEHVKDLGHGDLFFSAELFRKTFYKEKSHDNWQIMPFGVSISADVREER